MLKYFQARRSLLYGTEDARGFISEYFFIRKGGGNMMRKIIMLVEALTKLVGAITDLIRELKM